MSCERRDAADEMGVRVAVEWGPGPHRGQKLRPSPASAITLLEEALQPSMGSHCFPPSWPLTLPPFPPEKDLASPPFVTVAFNLHCALESPGKLDKLLVPQTRLWTHELELSGEEIRQPVTLPWWIVMASRDGEALTVLFNHLPTPDGRGKAAP